MGTFDTDHYCEDMFEHYVDEDGMERHVVQPRVIPLFQSSFTLTDSFHSVVSCWIPAGHGSARQL